MTHSIILFRYWFAITGHPIQDITNCSVAMHWDGELVTNGFVQWLECCVRNEAWNGLGYFVTYHVSWRISYNDVYVTLRVPWAPLRLLEHTVLLFVLHLLLQGHLSRVQSAQNDDDKTWQQCRVVKSQFHSIDSFATLKTIKTALKKKGRERA